MDWLSQPIRSRIRCFPDSVCSERTFFLLLWSLKNDVGIVGAVFGQNGLGNFDAEKENFGSNGTKPSTGNEFSFWIQVDDLFRMAGLLLPVRSTGVSARALSINAGATGTRSGSICKDDGVTNGTSSKSGLGSGVRSICSSLSGDLSSGSLEFAGVDAAAEISIEFGPILSFRKRFLDVNLWIDKNNFKPTKIGTFFRSPNVLYF